MKEVKLFYLRECPFCKKALRYIEQAKAKHSELADIEIEMIEESEQADVANQYDYYYVLPSTKAKPQTSTCINFV